VSSRQTVTITATSAAYPAKSASVAVSLNPPLTTGLTIVPSILNLLVGETHAIQALDGAGKPVTGLTWISSGPNVVSLSTDNPPLLTALTAGHVTIAAGTASADVTVYAAPLPVGTVIWSNPANGSAGGIVPAVPSPSGVADVFAAGHVSGLTDTGNVNVSGFVQAITSDGATAWSANVSEALPDFQGGLIELLFDGYSSGRGISGHTGIVRIDGITGQRYPVYTPDLSGDPLTGTDPNSPRYPRFGLDNILTLGVHPDGTVFTTEYHLYAACDTSGNNPCQQRGFLVGIDPTTGTRKFSVAMAGKNPKVESLIIAGDGYAYLPYWYQDGSTTFLNLLRVSSSGDATDIRISQSAQYYANGPAMITNADKGILITWLDGLQARMAIVSGTGVQLVSAPVIGVAGQYPPFTVPVLQAEDGSFVGIGWDGNGSVFMIAFNENGSVRWSVANKIPQIATADGSIIGTDPSGSAAVRFDQNGNAVEQIGALPTYSWRGNAYRLGSVQQIAVPPIAWASLWASGGGSPSRNSTAARPWFFALSFNNDFTFTPGYPGFRPELTTDISSKALVIKAAALKQFKDAYYTLPVTVTVVEGNKGDILTTVENHQNLINKPDCGSSQLAVDGKWRHQVDYAMNMQGAQDAYHVVINNAQDETAVLANRLDLIQAIGRGIGVTAAHELAHQFVDKPPMDNNPATNPAARGTFNATGCNGLDDPSPWTGYWLPAPPIFLHWEKPALDALGQALGKGWHDLPHN
jgi:hypothetical protein